MFRIESLESRVHLSRVMEYLDRGVVATRTSSTQAFVSWRLYANDPSGVGFNVYRSTNGGAAVKLNASVLTAGTNYTDTTVGSTNLGFPNAYYVRPVIGGVEQAASNSYILPANSPSQPYFSIPIRTLSDYHIKHINVADLNGDGKYDYILGRKPNYAVNEVAIQPSIVEAYLNDGTFLWSVNLGPGSYDVDNIEPGPTAIDIGNWDGVAVYDLDGDGKAEVFLRTANGVTFGDGATLSYPANNDVQFMSAINGLTGAERARIQIPTDYLADGPVGAMMAVGYLDGVNPSLVVKMKNRIGSGAFNQMIIAYGFNGTAITQQWKWNKPETGSYGEGHNIRIADVDQDGDDEVVEIGFVLNGDGTLKYNLGPAIVHGDRFYIGDFDPARPGLEGYGVQQNNSSLLMEYFYDAGTGQILHTTYGTSVGDNGRGDVGDIDPAYPGAEYWSFHGTHNSYNSVHTQITTASPWPSFGIQWDGDLQSETVSTDHAVIDQWNPSTSGTSRVATLYNMGSNATTADGWPIYVGDIIGDWREEVVYETATRDRLVIFSTSSSTTTRLYSLAQNPLYRNNMTTKGYVQTRNTDYYLGGGMSTPPTPNISVLTLVTDPNAAPTVATAAAASQTTVVGTTTNLSVLGADNAGEANLTYTWWATGGNGVVNFASNVSNAAKNTVATFTAAGTYTIYATIRDAGGKTVTSSVNVTVVQTVSNVAVTPATAAILVSGTQQFSAGALDQFGNSMTASLSYSWLVIGGGGTINGAGLYTAPTVPGNITVLAQSGSLSGTATVTVSSTIDTYQAEDATYAGGVIVDTNASGYTGTGFVNYPGSGGYVEWTNVDGASGGATSILFRYALATGSRTGQLTVNGVAQSITFTSTGAWNSWTTIQIPVTLNAGAVNTIRLASTGQDLSNVDSLQVYRGTGFNQVPTVNTPPSTAPNPVYGSTANLSVLGADDGGEAGLIYTWSAAGPAAVSFSSNGANSSKNTTATFTVGGTYTLAVAIRDVAGLTNATSMTVTVNLPLPAFRGWWKMDETGGAGVSDSSGNAFNGTAFNGPTWTSGKIGNAMNFDGSNDYVDLPNSLAVSSSTGSVSMWIKTGANFSDAAHLFYASPVNTGNGGGAENELHLNFLSDERLQFYIKGPASNGSSDVNLNSAAGYADNAWHHVAVTWDINGSATMYVDGMNVASATHDANSFTGTSVTRLGRPATATRYYNGLMDDVRLYNVALSASQVQAIATDTTAPAATVSSYVYDSSPNLLRVAFTEPVVVNAPVNAVLINRVGGGSIVPTAYSYDSLTNILTYQLPASVPDGDYSVSFAGSSVRDYAGNTLGSGVVGTFWSLGGDINRDRKVNTQDFNVLAGHFGSSGVFSDGDLNYDGTVDSVDFTAFAGKYGNSLPQPSAPLSAAATLFASQAIQENAAMSDVVA